MAGMLDSTLSRWFTPETLAARDHPGVEYARNRLLTNDAQAFAAGWRALAANDSWDRLHQIDAITTVLHATEDASISIGVSQRMAASIPGARMVHIRGPHIAQLEQWEAFEAATLDHLEWVDEVSAPNHVPSTQAATHP